MCCGKCNGNCGCGKGGNYTYIRYATDDSGSNISKYKNRDNDGNIDNLNRCYQSIFVSPVKLDQNSPMFNNNFTDWTYGCDNGCGCGDCEWFPYHTVEDYNVWSWKDGSLNLGDDPMVNNKAQGKDNYNGDIMTIPFFSDSDNNLISDNSKYCFEFKYDFSKFTNPTSSLEISFGNGPSATVISLNSTDTSGIYKGVINTNDGSLPSHTMVIRLVNDSVPSGTEIINFLIWDFKLAPEECCSSLSKSNEFKVCFSFLMSDFNLPT